MADNERSNSPSHAAEGVEGAEIEEHHNGAPQPPQELAAGFAAQDAQVGAAAAFGLAQPFVEPGVPFLPNGAALFADLQQYPNGLDAIHPSIIQHVIQYQQMLDNMRMMQLLTQDHTLQQFLYENSLAADAAANVQGGDQVPMPAGLNPLLNMMNIPTFPSLASSANNNNLSENEASQDPEPQLQEHDYDPHEEERKPYGQRCLLYLVEERYWVEALQRISTHPHEARQVGIQGRAPIHLACDHDAPAFLVHALLRFWSEGAFMVGTSYMNPLHITCSSQHASNEIVNLLLAGCGDPLRITGAKDGELF